ncbi:2-dehydro-3-deoxygluconokinase [Mycobacterium frederiksbergense]|uniref:2-dehydro-3-deoxygluconokinase n=1 Tax=Mycolicibacterium frederiksbergense TaxID=117567 RepID=A0ABT6L4F1_9MYCO|nr:sugar kinase [Mycolicibacterium frederiksbergense]MDH6197826.1 2-dehydro-3-deoxygluconokinase [Mycolicibacterium frederiksbergense]
MNRSIATYGEALALMMVDDGLPLHRAGHFRRSITGAEVNVAVALARLGHNVRWLGRLGDDSAGHAVLRFLRAESIDISHVGVDSARPTGMLVRDSYASDAMITIDYYRQNSAASASTYTELKPGWLDGVELLHLTGITAMLSPTAPAMVNALIDLAQQRAITVSFDPNIRRKLAPIERWQAVVAPLLERADIVIAGDDEVHVLTGQEPMSWAHRSVNDGYGTAVPGPNLQAGKTVVLKHPDKSSTAITADSKHSQAALPTQLIDPIGAGDAFAAGYLSGISCGLPLQQCLHRAALLGARAVTTRTDTDGLPTAADIQAYERQQEVMR